MPKIDSAPVRGSDVGQQRAGLQRHGRVPPDLDPDLDDHVAARRERGVDVAVAEGEIGRHVPGREQARRARPRRRRGVQHRRCLIDVDLDELGGVLGGVRVLGDHDGERLAHVAHHVGGEHRLQVARSGRCPGAARRTGMASPGGRSAAVDGPVTPAARRPRRVHRAQAPVGDGGADDPGPAPGPRR